MQRTVLFIDDNKPLGYKSNRTTEIYTHVSRRNLFAIRSPIEDMDLE